MKITGYEKQAFWEMFLFISLSNFQVATKARERDMSYFLHQEKWQLTYLHMGTTLKHQRAALSRESLTAYLRLRCW